MPLYLLYFLHLINNVQKIIKSSWKINNLTDFLVFHIAEQFYSLFLFWLALQVHQNAAQVIKIILHTKNSNKIY